MATKRPRQERVFRPPEEEAQNEPMPDKFPAPPPGSPLSASTEFRRGFPFFVESLGPPFETNQADPAVPGLTRTQNYSDFEWMTYPGTDVGVRKVPVSYADLDLNGNIVLQSMIMDGGRQGQLMLTRTDPDGPEIGDVLQVQATVGGYVSVRSLASEAKIVVRAEIEALPLVFNGGSTGSGPFDAWTTVRLGVTFPTGEESTSENAHQLAGPQWAGLVAPARSTPLSLSVTGKLTPAYPSIHVHVLAELWVARKFLPPVTERAASTILIGGSGDRQPIFRLTSLVAEAY